MENTNFTKYIRTSLENLVGYPRNNPLMIKLTPKIILEGTRLTFKTDIVFALNEHPRIVGPRKYKHHSPLISAEWCTFTNVPWGGGPINFEPPAGYTCHNSPLGTTQDVPASITNLQWTIACAQTFG